MVDMPLNQTVRFLLFPRVKSSKKYSICYMTTLGGVRGVMVIVVGKEYSDTSSNPGRD